MRLLSWNAQVERVVGSIRRACLDHVVVVNAAGRQRVLTGVVEYDMPARTHLALDQDAPISRPTLPPTAGRLVAISQVGGIHRRYDRSRAA